MSTVSASGAASLEPDRLPVKTRCGTLLAAAACCGALGDLRDSLELLLYGFGAAIAFAVPLGVRWRAGGARNRIGVVVVIAALAGASQLGCAAQLAALAVAFAVTERPSAAQGGGGAAEVTAWVAAIAVTALFLALHERFASLHELVRRGVTAAMTALTGLVSGKSVPLGPTMIGWPMIWLAMSLQLARIWLSPAGQRMWGRRIAVTLAPVVAAPLLFALAAAWSAAPANPIPTSEHAFDTDLFLRRHASVGQFLFPANVRMLIAMAVAACELWWARPATLALASGPTRTSLLSRVAAIAVAVGYPAWSSWILKRDLPESTSAPRVLFHDPSTVYFRAPRDGEWGLTVSFAALPALLQQSGYQVSTKPVDRAALATADVVVMVNLHERLAPDALAALRDWLVGGGSLLCLGDHTGDEQIRIPFNEVLADVGIAFEFDSARSLGGWGEAGYWLDPHLYPDRWPQHAVTDTSAVGIGASLTLTGQAVPVMIGGNAFSDPGDRKATDRGMVGNLVYDYGEPLGDLVLVAASRLGKGRVLVFGDTSPFQSTALPTTAGFVARVFEWLTRPVPERFVLGHLSLLGLAAVLMALWRSTPVWRFVTLAAAVALHVRADRLSQDAWDPAAAITSAHPECLAWIDAYHHPSVEPFGAYGFDGLPPNLSRRGWVPRLWQRDWRSLPRAGLLVSCDARRTLAAGEVDEIERFLERGGNMLLTVSYESRVAHAQLLERFGIEIPFEPLGRFRTKSQVGDALEVECVSGWPMRIRGPHEPLVTPWKHVVAAKFVRGKGSLVVIADGQYLRANNLESTGGFVHSRNAAFVRELCKMLGSPQ